MTSITYTRKLTNGDNLQFWEQGLIKIMEDLYGFYQWQLNIPCNQIESAADAIVFAEFYIECGLVAPDVCKMYGANTGIFYFCPDCQVYHSKMFSLN